MRYRIQLEERRKKCFENRQELYKWIAFAVFAGVSLYLAVYYGISDIGCFTPVI
jgi:hypothetical protein